MTHSRTRPLQLLLLLSAAVLLASCTGTENPLQPKLSVPDAPRAVLEPGSGGVLILGPSVTGGTSSPEALAATALGLPVTVVTNAQWAALTAEQFSSYRAIILGDPTCMGGAGPVAAAAANNAVWGPTVNGNVFIIGSDPVYHAKTDVTRKGVAFATASAGKTGAYITASCYYAGAGTPVVATFLSGLSSLGSFTMMGAPGCFNDAYKVADSPSLAGLTNAYLSNWGCSVHEVFATWPSDFEVLAIARGVGAAYTASDGTRGTPYILARGELVVLSDVQLAPATGTPTLGATYSITATLSTAGVAQPGKTVEFTIEDGPNAGQTFSAVTDATGVATISYSSPVAGTDGIRARYTQDGRTQTSNRITVAWTVPTDVTPPVIAHTISGTLGANGWYTSDVVVTWSSTDGESPITSPACAPVTVSTNTASVTVSCSATSLGGTATDNVVIKRDATPPTVQSTVNGALGGGGWYTSTVTVNWSASDDVSGVAAIPCAPNVLATDNAGTTYTCTATNDAGLSASASRTVKRDATSPVVSYSGNTGGYTVDQTVAISCVASDAMSGIASNSCVNITGEGWSFAPGVHSYSATASDVAGNASTATTSFTISVTAASVCTLVERWSSKENWTNSLCVKLQQGNLEAFRNELAAQSGKAISAANAAILLQLANAL